MLSLFEVLFLVLLSSISSTASAGDQLLFKTPNPQFKKWLQTHPDAFAPLPFKVEKHRPKRLRITLPARYDLRSLHLTTPPKNQSPYGACWAFATYKSLESDLLVEGEGRYDFSENNLINRSGFDIGFTSGGNILVSSAYLARGDGPVLASCDPYPNPGGSPATCKRVKYIENIHLLPPRNSIYDNEYIKEALYRHGALYAPIYFDLSYYNPSSYTYYYSGAEKPNHAIAIVGWDDNMYIPTAPAPGAWIVESSWGTDWADGGYFYVSYYDSSIATSGYIAYFSDEPDLDNGSFKIYQYDKFGMETGITCAFKNSISGVNVFRSTQKGFIAAVGFFVSSPSNYTISVYRRCSSPETTDSQSPDATASGRVSESGYYTVKLKKPVFIEDSESFCLRVDLQTENSDAYPMAIEMKIPYFSSGVSIQPGESYFSCTKGLWEDMYGYYSTDGAGNICIKAMSVKPPFPDITGTYDWAVMAIIQLKNAGIINGYTDGTYGPEDNLTRAQIAKIISKSMGLPVERCSNKPFSDVGVDQWYCAYIQALKENGFISGYPDGTYRPDKTVSRAQMAAFIAKALHLPIRACIEKPFSDVPVGSAYCPYILAIKSKNIVSGYPDGTFKPENPITRAEAAVIIQRAFFAQAEQ